MDETERKLVEQAKRGELRIIQRECHDNPDAIGKSAIYYSEEYMCHKTKRAYFKDYIDRLLREDAKRAANLYLPPTVNE